MVSCSAESARAEDDLQNVDDHAYAAAPRRVARARRTTRVCGGLASHDWQSFQSCLCTGTLQYQGPHCHTELLFTSNTLAVIDPLGKTVCNKKSFVLF